MVDSTGENKKRRKHVRFPINLSVRYYENAAEPCDDFILNISMGGVYIKSESPLKEGAKISMDFEIPPKIRYLGKFEGEVVAINSDDPRYPKGMFVKFINAGAEQLKRLEDFLESHRHLIDEEA